VAKRWPAIPKVISGMAGPIKVSQRRRAVIAEDGEDCWGLYLPAKRTIALAPNMPPALRWHTLFHEWAHAWIIDAGLPNLIHGNDAELDRNIEVFCDTLATAMARGMASHLGLDPYVKK